jgi:hypothetical protein
MLFPPIARAEVGTMIKTRIPHIVLVLAIVTLAGCGGGSSGSGGGGTITGRISDFTALAAPNRAAGDPIRISIEGTNLNTTANPDGTFTIGGVPGGLHTIIARTTTHAAAFCARVRPGGETQVGEIPLRESGQVSGLVTSAENHAPIPAARITVTELIYTNTADVAPHPVRVTRTNASGSYTVGGLPAGEYLISVDKDGFESESLVTWVSPFSTTPGDIRLHAADPAARGIMAGTAYVVDEDGTKAPVAGVLIRIAPRNLPDPPVMPLPGEATGANGAAMDLWGAAGRAHSFRDRYTHTDDSGAYSLDGIPAGDYVAVAVRPGLEPDHKPVTISGSQTTTVDFELRVHRPRIGTVEGRVVSAEDGSPIANAGVSLLHGPMPMPPGAEPGGGGGYSPPGSVGGGTSPNPGTGGGSGGIFILPDEYDFYATTDSNGRFRMRAPAREIVLDVWAEGYLPGQQSVSVPLGGTVTTEIKLRKLVTREVTLSGHVVAVTADGVRRPVPEATVFAAPMWDYPHLMAGSGSSTGAVSGGESSRPSMVYTATTDREGRYELKLQSGVYHLSASKDNYISEPLRLEIVEDTTQNFAVKEYPSPPPPER